LNDHPTQRGVNPLLAAAFASAARTGSPTVEVGHLALAILSDQSTTAFRVLSNLGTLKENVTQLLHQDGPAGERPAGITLSRPVQSVLDLARGLALAQGLSEPDSTHILVATFYSRSTSWMWDRLGVSADEILSGLAAAGVSIPPTPPPSPARRVAPEAVTFPMTDRESVLRALARAYPPGSDAFWGWNVIADDRCIVYGNDPSAIRTLVEAAVEDPSRISLLSTSATEEPPDA
jgi:hypothetical protein